MEIQHNQIYNEDCLQFMKQLPDKYFDLIITDPPYGIKMTSDGFGGSKNADKTEYVKVEDWDKETPSEEVFKEMQRVSKNQIIFGGNYFTDKLPVTNCWVCWDKRCGVTPERTYADCEFIWTSFNQSARMIRFVWDGFIQDTKNKIKDKRYHPTQKPVEVLRQLIRRFAKEGDLIFDPFAGSGSHLVACKQLGFKFVGCEINKDYVEITKRRLAQGSVADFTQPNGCPDGSFNSDLKESDKSDSHIVATQQHL